MREGFNFVAIGDVVTDAFIRLKEASVHCDIDKERCVICLRFADKVPYESVHVIPAVGNSANAAVAASRLGLQSALVSNLGNDDQGKEALDALRNEKVNTDGIVVHPGQKTNYHYVLWYDDDRTILVKHEPYEYSLPDIDEPAWVYLSSLGENSLPFHSVLADYFEAHPNVNLAFQPGTFQMKFGAKALEKIYKRANVFICNREEATRVLESEESDVKKLLAGLHALGPKIVVITDGKSGAYALEGSDVWFMPIYPDPKPPYERTGAGDAFSSTFVSVLALGKSVEEALMWAPINSMSVVQDVGARAGLLKREKLEEYLSKAPPDYRPKKI